MAEVYQTNTDGSSNSMKVDVNGNSLMLDLGVKTIEIQVFSDHIIIDPIHGVKYDIVPNKAGTVSFRFS